MLDEPFGLNESGAAAGTLVLFIPGMLHFMPPQGVMVCKAAVTHLTGKWFLTGVPTKMCLQHNCIKDKSMR